MSEQKKTATKKIFVYLRIGFVLVAVLAVAIWVSQNRRYVILGQSFAKMGPVLVESWTMLVLDRYTGGLKP